MPSLHLLSQQLQAYSACAGPNKRCTNIRCIRFAYFVHIILPSALPDIVTGLRTSIGITHTALVAAEMVAATSGIGWMVLDASKYMRSDIVFVGIIIMGLIAIFIDILFSLPALSLFMGRKIELT